MSHLVGKVIQENESLFKDISHKIWSNPELSFQETYAHDLLTAALEKFGFEVQKNYLLPTAFRAEFCNSKVFLVDTVQMTRSSASKRHLTPLIDFRSKREQLETPLCLKSSVF
ncbi:peptidase M20 domain-containing protein 2 [Trichonephila inaurata madagascariensis]|uniref:Peptidase M20 domain-containing protein 2 n=1 Tax=Trichonephila inaurata madagascariensis TaxID=2747483 RepID=A0A8X6JI84_9ARAC|nr:peptidase M20 domain-containing protein 2 [Trichonephila inaurata madagascariensis]